MPEALIPTEKKTIYSVIAAVIIIALFVVLLWWAFKPAIPAGGITQDAYDKLTPTDQALYVKDTKSGYWVKK